MILRLLLCCWICSALPLSGSAQTKKPIKRSSLLIHLPDSVKEEAYPLLICFGGSMWADPQFLWEETPPQYFSKAIMVYSPCFIKGGKGLRRVELEIQAYLQQNNISISHTSVCGFSSGGPDAMIAEQPHRYKAIGLIDCCPRANGRVEYCSNMIFSYRRNSWVNSDYYGKVVNFKPFDELILKIKAAGGYTEESDIPHNEYFKYFLNKFEKELIGTSQ